MIVPTSLLDSGLVLILATKVCAAWEIRFYSDQHCRDVIYTDSGNYETKCIEPVLPQQAYSL